MKRGKRICSELKAIRRKIADENGIKMDIPECTYEGDCRGTCPRCEWEVKYLEKNLFERLKLGKIATISGIVLGLSSCGGNADTQLIQASGDNADTQLIQASGDSVSYDIENVKQGDSLQQLDEDDDDWYAGVVVPEDYKEEPPPPPPPEMYNESL
ncbi:MAG: hypothetical protein J6Z26_01755 [Bacteroidales bacterium]|nr:hypothetical protein [Bacteroidales bacterium]